MFTFLSIVYVFVCLFLILVVLLQSGKGGGLGGLGGGATQQVFGGAGAGNILTRMTAVCAFLFMTLAISLEYLSTSTDRSLERVMERRTAAPASVGADSDDDEEAAAPAATTPPPAPTSEPTEAAPAPAGEAPAAEAAPSAEGATEAPADEPAPATP